MPRQNRPAEPGRGERRAPWRRWAPLLAGLGLLAAAGCTPGAAQEPAGVQVPGRVLFYEAVTLEDQSLLTDAALRLETLVAENPGTRLGTFAYLKLAEIYAQQEKWAEADTAYRQFLALNSNSHFTPYVLYRLMNANYQLGITGLFFPSREVERDMEPNRQLALEFKRFFLLYPNSGYMDEVRPFYRAARDLLAEYELMVGDFYMEREHYNAAIGRYLYLLKYFPEYPDTEEALVKLIEAYRANRQPALADEMEQVYIRQFGTAQRANGATVTGAPSRSGSER